jgi:hypothetical protein
MESNFRDPDWIITRDTGQERGGLLYEDTTQALARCSYKLLRTFFSSAPGAVNVDGAAEDGA